MTMTPREFAVADMLVTADEPNETIGIGWVKIPNLLVMSPQVARVLAQRLIEAADVVEGVEVDHAETK